MIHQQEETQSKTESQGIQHRANGTPIGEQRLTPMTVKARIAETGSDSNGSRLVWWVMGIVGSLLSAGLLRDMANQVATEHRMSVLETESARDRDYFRERLEAIVRTLDSIDSTVRSK
jgi:hypothetical protein